MNRSTWRQAIRDVSTALSNTRHALDAAEYAFEQGDRSQCTTDLSAKLRDARDALDAARDIADDGLLYAEDD